MGVLLGRGLSRKILFMLVGGATMTTVCTGIFSYYLAGKLRKESAGAVVERGAENLASQIDVSLGAAVGLVRQLAADTQIRQALEKES
jgi:NhaP-type Na+/H+ or K+/H+ antiporter